MRYYKVGLCHLRVWHLSSEDIFEKSAFKTAYFGMIDAVSTILNDYNRFLILKYVWIEYLFFKIGSLHYEIYEKRPESLFKKKSFLNGFFRYDWRNIYHGCNRFLTLEYIWIEYLFVKIGQLKPKIWENILTVKLLYPSWCNIMVN